MTRVVRLNPVTGTAGLIERLEHPEPLLKQWGALLVAESQRAFREQKFGDVPWPVRYPRQAEPFVNFATIVMHANRGSPPKPRHFRRTPALIDEGGTGLRGSITSELEGPDTVAVGTTKPYASRHQEGGEDTQPVTATAKDTLRQWFRRKVAAPYRRKMRFLLFRDELSTTVHARPFIGITPRGEDRLRMALEAFVAGGDGTPGEAS